MTQTVLVSGASIAGPTLAYWLTRHGFATTVVERSPVPRPGGQAVDVRGVALEVAERMGVLAELRAARTAMRGMAFVDADGTELMSTTEMSLTGGPTDSPDVEILRDDLSEILLAATPDVEYVYGDSITAIDQTADGVAVTFRHGCDTTSPSGNAYGAGPTRSFDLVIGADGLHSALRTLAFGPESDYVRHLGSYLAVFSTPNFLDLDHWQVFQQTPGKMAGIYSARHNAEARVVMGYESERIEYDYRDAEQQKRLIATAFAGDRWEVPRMLELMETAPDFYFDSMSQIHLPSWSNGRVALVGDAGYCASPLSGQGTSLAMVGAYVLAGELKAAGGDHVTAFANYEAEMREFVRVNQHLALTNKESTQQAMEQQVEGIEEQIGEHWLATAATSITLKSY